MSEELQKQNESHPCKCDYCEGKGTYEDDIECECCDGSGDHSFEADCGAWSEASCEKCDGTGWEKKEVDCNECHGTGLAHSCHFVKGQKDLMGNDIEITVCDICGKTEYKTAKGLIIKAS